MQSPVPRSPSISIAVPLLGVADVAQRHVVVLAPEERHGVEALAAAEHVARGDLALPLGDDPVLDAHALAACADRASARCRRRRRSPGALVSRYSSTTTPRSTVEARLLGERDARAARRRRARRGRRRASRRRSASTVASVDAGAVSPRWNATPCSSCSAADEAARARGRARARAARCSGATTCTSRPRARSDAATSSPMKLAPTTTARLRLCARRAMIARLSASVRR